MNGPIGKQMVDTFFESSANFEVSDKKFLHDLPIDDAVRQYLLLYK